MSLSFACILLTISSGCARYKLSAVNMAPLGPSLYSFITYLSGTQYLFILVSFPDVDERLVGEDFDCGI